MLAKTEAVPGQVCNRVGKIHIFWSEIGQWFQDAPHISTQIFGEFSPGRGGGGQQVPHTAQTKELQVPCYFGTRGLDYKLSWLR